MKIVTTLSIDLFKNLLSHSGKRYISDDDDKPIWFIARSSNAVEDISSIMTEILDNYDIGIKHIHEETEESSGNIKLEFEYGEKYDNMILIIPKMLLDSEYIVITFFNALTDKYSSSAILDERNVLSEEYEESKEVERFKKKIRKFNVGSMAVHSKNHITKNFEMEDFIKFSENINTSYDFVKYNISASTSYITDYYRNRTDLYAKSDKQNIAKDLNVLSNKSEVVGIYVYIDTEENNDDKYSSVDETLDSYKEIHKYTSEYLKDIHDRGSVYSICSGYELDKRKMLRNFIFPDGTSESLFYIRDVIGYTGLINSQYNYHEYNDSTSMRPLRTTLITSIIQDLVSDFLMENIRSLYPDWYESDTNEMYRMRKWKDFSSEVIPYLNTYLKKRVYVKSIDDVKKDISSAKKSKALIVEPDNYPIFALSKNDSGEIFFNFNKFIKNIENDELIKIIAETILANSPVLEIKLQELESLIKIYVKENIHNSSINIFDNNRNKYSNIDKSRFLFTDDELDLVIRNEQNGWKIDYNKSGDCFDVNKNIDIANTENIIIISNKGKEMTFVDHIEDLPGDFVIVADTRKYNGVSENMVTNLLSSYENLSKLHLKLIMSRINNYRYTEFELYKRANMTTSGSILLALSISDAPDIKRDVLYSYDFDIVKKSAFEAVESNAILKEMNMDIGIQPLFLNNSQNRINVIIPKDVKNGVYSLNDSESRVTITLDDYYVLIETNNMIERFIIEKSGKRQKFVIFIEINKYADFANVSKFKGNENELKFILNLFKRLGYTKVDSIK